MSSLSPELSEAKQKKPPVEIERKFVITALPEGMDLSDMDGERIEQGYLANGSGRNTVRLRKKGDDEYSQTVKWRIGDNPAERVELEYDISEDQFETFWPATEGRRVQKTRYEIPHGDRVIELDVFEDDSGSHMVAEVEFPTTLEADLFVPPDWFGPDVTADGRFGNANIAKAGFPDITTVVQ